MIRSFKHKGLQRLFEYDEPKLINRQHEERIRTILTALDRARTIVDMNFPGSGLHRLKGDKQEIWSVKVSGNWRITFIFEDRNAYNVNLEDYH